jgi:hypothetical protein
MSKDYSVANSHELDNGDATVSSLAASGLLSAEYQISTFDLIQFSPI